MGRRRDISRRNYMAGALTVAAASVVAVAQQRGAGRMLPRGRIPVAFLISEGATVIDFCGPWEVFQDADVAGVPGFELYTVGQSREPIRDVDPSFTSTSFSTTERAPMSSG